VVEVVWILIIAGVVLVAVAVWAADRSMRSRRLQQRFGPEYQREVERAGGDRRQAESALGDRVSRREELELRPLSPAARDAYRVRWEEAQAEFVDEPEAAVEHAQTLLDEVMTECGYPIGEAVEERVDLVSVDHPEVVEHYRVAYRLHRDSGAIGDTAVSTEDRRQAMVYYRALFDELLDTDTDTGDDVRDADEADVTDEDSAHEQEVR
jgi:hypothetical protein